MHICDKKYFDNTFSDRKYLVRMAKKFQKLSYSMHNTFVQIACDKCSHDFVIVMYIAYVYCHRNKTDS